MGQHRVDCRVEIGEEALEIDNCRAAIHPVCNIVDRNLPSVASRAGHADNFAAALAGDSEADRHSGNIVIW
jgi:hypothetical protein